MLGRRTWVYRKWRLPVAVGLLLLGLNTPPPNLFGSAAYETCAFIAAAGTMVVASYHRTLFTSILACMAAVCAMSGRALVVVLVASELSTEQVIRGIALWYLGATLIMMMTILTDPGSPRAP